MNFISDLHAGRAGEHLATADLIMNGLDAFLAAQGMPYDIIADVNSCLLKVQAKSTRKPEVLTQRNINNVAYRFWVSRCGKSGTKRYDANDVDLFALVALDTRQVGYISVFDMPRTLFVRPEALRGTYDDEITASRNAIIKSRVLAGEDEHSLAAEYKLTKQYINKIKNGRGRTHTAGVYMADLTLEKALVSLQRGQSRKGI